MIGGLKSKIGRTEGQYGKALSIVICRVVRATVILIVICYAESIAYGAVCHRCRHELGF